MNTLEKVGELINSGHEEKFVELVEKIESKVVLNKDLEEKLSDLGNTPVDEPELAKALESGKITFLKEILTNEEIEKYSAQEVGDFLYAAEQQIISIKTEDGTYKTTKNTEDCRLPNFLEADEILKLGEKERKAQENLRSAKGDKSVKKAIESATKASEKFTDKAFEISGLDVENLTDWEKLLVKTQVYMSAINATLSATGKSLGNL